MKKASAPRPAPPPPQAPAPTKAGWEWLGIAALAGLTVFFLATSWRKWPDPLIDFGRELYLPWRLAQGAVLYRDVDDFYGPLSQYFNAGLFKLFGPGMMVLVTANLVIFAGILAIIYRLFRSAWGAGAAFVSSALFVAVFGFSQLVGIGNYNYATPYAHEATHGMLVCLGLVALLPAWVEQPTVRRSFAVGGLCGLSAVLKPEIMLAAGVVMLVAWLVQRWRRRPWTVAGFGAWAAGAVLPTVIFAGYFFTHVSWASAWEFACRAWLNAATSSRFTGDPVQQGFLGFDQPGPHLLQHAGASLVAFVLIGMIAGGVRLMERAKDNSQRAFFLSGVIAGMGVLATLTMPWANAGRCLLGLAVVYGVVSALTLVRRTSSVGSSNQTLLRLLLPVLAVALLGRMLLNGRIYQFGFYQAALAALLVPAVVIGELPARMGATRWGRAMAVAGCLALLVPGVVILSNQSREWLRLKTYAVGEGKDQFYTFEAEVDPTGNIIRQASSWLRTAATGELRPAAGAQVRTLLVLPEGEMINYLARLPSPVAPFFFFSAATSDGREAEIVGQLERNPPEWVALVSRDLREYGVQRYGESAEQGGQILEWTRDRYAVAATLGGNPLDYRERGLIILQRKR